MRKGLPILASMAMVLSFVGNVANADVILADEQYRLYANGWTSGTSINVNTSNVARLNPENALGEFDALQQGHDDKFYSVASREYTTYTFGREIFNVNTEENPEAKADILLNEVTWGNWHVEAVKVYLKDAYVKNADGKIVPYKGNDDGHGYYAGVAWNKVGQKIDSDKKSEYEKLGYEDRGFNENYYEEKGNIQWTGIHLPDEVVYASGVTLVDVTKDVHDMGKGITGYNPNSYKGNDDGYDLDAISVYTSDPKISVKDGGSDSVTGNGTDITNKGNWFMYNEYDASNGNATFDLVAGRNKTKVGEYTVTDNGDGTYTVDYKFDEYVEIDGYKYAITVKDEHLGIYDKADKITGKPGKDSNQYYGKPFKYEDGKFNIFAHFSIDYTAAINSMYK